MFVAWNYTLTLLGVCPGQPPVPRLRQDAVLYGEERDRNIFTGTLDAVQFKVSWLLTPRG